MINTPSPSLIIKSSLFSMTWADGTRVIMKQGLPVSIVSRRRGWGEGGPKSLTRLHTNRQTDRRKDAIVSR